MDVIFRPLLIPAATLFVVILTSYVYIDSLVPSLYLRWMWWTVMVIAIILVVRDQILAPFAIMPSIFLGRLKKAELTTMRNDFLKRNSKMIQPVTLITSDKVKLDGMMWLDPSQNDAQPDNQKWIIWCNPNGATYEEEFPFLAKYGRIVGANILAFNYRGVVLSESSPTTAFDLERDGDAAMQYLLSQGVRSRNILLHGHSMGGAVAVKTRVKYPDGPIISDRSFRSLSAVVGALLMTNSPLRTFVSLLMGAVISGYISALREVSGSDLMINLFVGTLAFGMVGSYLPYPIAQFAVLLIELMQWGFHITDSWVKIQGEKVIIYHNLDGIITHSDASLFEALQERGTMKGTHVIQLKFINGGDNKPNPFYHCYGLDSIDDEWQDISGIARRLLYGS
eukprot:TRINITY_DN2496_c0_g1_i1.p1 TRINITY_DN2496_c0_g1~~TRINITY_DN2496_c0_g1_i1.p1  ORF type:complete len:395 (-),score=89.63 TRINITY_DN2496_c0_g1_i1:25-1209(-)